MIAEMDVEILSQFERCAANGDEWDGDDFYGCMFQFWLRSKQEQKSTSDDKEIHFYPNAKFEINFESSEDESLSGEAQNNEVNVIEMDGIQYSISDVELETIGEIPICVGADEASCDQLVSNGCIEKEAMKSDPPVISSTNVFQLLEDVTVHNKIKIGQRKQRKKVERACLPSSSMNITAMKEKIELKKAKQTEIERKKMLRQRKKTEMLLVKKHKRKPATSFVVAETPSNSPSAFTDESSAQFTPSSSPVKLKRQQSRARRLKHRKRVMRVESSDSQSD